MSVEIERLLSSAKKWVESDPHRPTQVLGQSILDSADIEVIKEHFGSRLQFGTAGLRGEMGPGPNRMNHATVRRAAYGFARHLMNEDTNVAQVGIVIGFDARHGSRAFAEETARVFGALGLPSYLYDTCEPTPVVAHAITFLNAAGGVIVTASHNPPKDNGYKVYWGNGAQIIPPHDRKISDLIDSVDSIDEIKVGALEQLRSEGIVKSVSSEVKASYFEEILAQRVASKAAELSIVYTAMHGVGYSTMKQALNDAGYMTIHPVEKQVEPDPEFPTVAFPNPEEDGAMDLALDTAKTVDADLVIANDPDADRLCVAVKQVEGNYRLLTGNEVGVLIGDELLRHKCCGSSDLVATTIVSSQLLSKLAQQYGADFSETLTGFKWLANAAISKEKTGGRFLFGFEEALGYSVGPVVRDKDGISVALILCDLASTLKSQGQTLLDRLRDIYLVHGVYVSSQHSITLPGATGRQKIASMMEGLRTSPPSLIGDLTVQTRIDYQHQTVTTQDGVSPLDVQMPRSNVLAYYLSDGTRILARPSGTEPKIKFYFEARVELSNDDTLTRGEAQANEHMHAVCRDFLQLLGAVD